MKKIIVFFLFVLVLYSCQDQDIQAPNDSDDENPSYVESDKDVVKGFMRIKLKEEPEGEVRVRSNGGEVETGVRALDPVATSLGITHMQRTFPYAGKYEERTRRKGLHLWYDVTFSEEVGTTRAVEQVSALGEFEIVSPVRKIATREAAPFNDEFLPKQWNFHNSGTEGNWQVAGSDIRLFDIWEQYNGHPDVIVAVVDGGLTVNHPDLKANIWVNPGEIAGNGIDDDKNGYIDDIHGYNFVHGNGEIVPHRHGTHVGGIIGAVNNNGIGVAGIAGGNGTANSGVKLMSCQIFAHPGNGNYDSNADRVAKNTPAAIKYGADNGAVISQNSWGFTDSQPDVLAAIDYFVEFAGCDKDGNQLPDSPMKGGLVLVAVNNGSSSNPGHSAPADYEKVIGVAALSADYKKASYSDYGDYVDISAPGGGNVNVPDIQKIYSTTIPVSPYSYYEAMSGSSMACPHVSGVAALVIEKYGVGKPGLTPQRVTDILLSTAYNIESYNPNYAGQLGTGCVNAYGALYEEPPVIEPFTFKTNVITDGELSFVVNADYSGDAVITIYNNMGMKVIHRGIKAKKYIANTFDVSRLTPGQYNFEYSCNGNLVKEKFMKY